MNIGSVTFMLGANTAGLTRAAGNMRRFESQVLGSNARMQSSFAALGSKMMLVGTMMTQYLTVPIALIASAGVVAFAKYEAQMAKIVALTGTTQAQANSWSHDILSMSKEFGQAPKDVAAAMYFIASPALKASTAMDVLKASSMGAAIGLGETTVIGKTLVNVINAYGESNITASHALDVMLTATKNGVMEASDLGGALGKVIPTAQALGVGFEDLTGSIAALTLTGKTANEASVQLNRLFSTLIQARPRAEKVLDSFGISFEGLRKTLRDQGMMATIQKLSKMIGGNTLDEIQNTKAFEDNIDVLGDVFTNLRALLPVLDMLGPNMKNWTNILDNMTKSSGSAAIAWNVISGTVAERFKIAVASMKVSLVGFGETIKEPLIGLIQSFARGLENLSNWFQSLSSSTQKSIIGWAGFFVVLGPVLLILGSLVGMLVAVGTALGALGVIMLAHPWVQFATAAALLVGVLASMYNNYTKLNGVQQALNDVNAKASKSFIDVTISMQRLLSVAENDLTDKETRLDVIKQLNTISPKYLGYLNEESFKTNAAAKAINRYLDSLYVLEKYKAAIKAQDANRNTKMQLVADPINSLSGWNDFFDSIGKGYLTHRKYINYIIQGLDKEYEALQKITYEYELQEDLKNRFSKIPTSEKPLFYIDPQAFTKIEMFGKQIGVIWDKITGTDRTTSKDPMGIWKMTQDAATAAREKLEFAAKAAADFWKAYAGKDVAGKMSDLMGLMETANGKALEGYTREWVALDKIAKKKQELIDMTKAGLDTTSIKPLAGKVQEVMNRWSFAVSGGNELKQAFNNELAKMDTEFLSWYKTKTLEGQHNIEYANSLLYDYYSFYKNKEYLNPEFGIDKHFPDTYKRPGHPTFSNESIYSTPENQGGQWTGEDYNPRGSFLSGFKNIQTFKTPDDFKKDTKSLNSLDNINKQIGLNGIYAKSFEDIDKVGTELAQTLSFIGLKQMAVGDSFKGSEEIQTALNNALDGYLTVMNETVPGTDAWIAANLKVAETLNLIQTKTQDNIKVLEAWRSLFRDISSLMSTVGQYLGEQFQKVFNIITEIVRGVGEFIRILKDIGVITDKLSGGNKKTEKNNGSDLLATVITVGTTLLPFLLAKGGTVPSGFPNDSFPAMLTSGETVVPAFDSARMFGNGAGMNINVVVEGITKGSDIHYIVKEVERKLKNSN